MIRSSTSVHDRTQFETVFDYSLSDRGYADPSSVGVRKYRIDSFFFFPPQIRINPGNYSRDDFYQDLSIYLRLKEPLFSFKDFWTSHDTSGRSPLFRMREIFFGSKKIGEAESKEIIDQARIFSCLYANYFLRKIDKQINKIEKKTALKNIKNHSKIERDFLILQRIISRGRLLLCELRTLSDSMRDFSENLRGNLKNKEENGGNFSDVCNYLLKELDLVIEYCSYVFRDGLVFTTACVATYRPNQESQVCDDLAYVMKVYTRYEHWFSSKNKLLWISSHSGKQLREEFIYRKSLLRKRVGQILFLKVKEKPLFAFRREVGNMVAAGLAALWAVSVQIFLWQFLHLRGVVDALDRSSVLSLSGVALAVLSLVMAYVLKDRIKEFGRVKFKQGIFGDLPDHSDKIYFVNSRDEHIPVGIIQESYRFLGGPANIPSEIFTQRTNEARDQEITGEQVIHYWRKIELDGKILGEFDPPFYAVRDIMRFNFSRFLEKLDDPQQEYVTINKFGELETLMVNKTYLIILIFRYEYRDAFLQTEKITYEKKRLIVSKDGLVRVEES